MAQVTIHSHKDIKITTLPIPRAGAVDTPERFSSEHMYKTDARELYNALRNTLPNGTYYRLAQLFRAATP